MKDTSLTHRQHTVDAAVEVSDGDDDDDDDE